MSTEESRKFRVEIQEIADQPIAGPDGVLHQAVRFRVTPTAESAPFEVDAGLTQGDTLFRSFQLKEKGAVTVQMPAGWHMSDESNWKQQIVDAALDRAMSEGA